MNLNVGKELAALRRMTVGELRGRYAEAFGETTHVRHKEWLVKRIIWRMQALVEGDLPERGPTPCRRGGDRTRWGTVTCGERGRYWAGRARGDVRSPRDPDRSRPDR